MASAPPVTGVEEEIVKCPICLAVLTDPVTLDCGHRFCRGCITECCETLEDLGAVQCPICRVRIKVTDAESKEVTRAASPNKATQLPPTASAPPVTGVEEEATCPICKELFTDPVTLNCGHNFCRGCITQYCDIWEQEGKLECPACRDKIKGRNFRPNWQLANIAEKIRERKKHLCAQHQEELNLFCKKDDEFLCVACWRSPEHELHTVLLLEEAAQEYKKNIQVQLLSLEKKREELVEQKVAEEQRIQGCLKQLEEQKLKITSDFKEMHKFLEEKERVWLMQLADLEKEIKERQKENMTRLSEEISHFRDLLKDVEEKCQQPACEFLQDIRRTWGRVYCQERPLPPTFLGGSGSPTLSCLNATTCQGARPATFPNCCCCCSAPAAPPPWLSFLLSLPLPLCRLWFHRGRAQASRAACAAAAAPPPPRLSYVVPIPFCSAGCGSTGEEPRSQAACTAAAAAIAASRSAAGPVTTHGSLVWVTLPWFQNNKDAPRAEPP